ncbi:MAG: hypothetical protein H0U23_10140 [Blastocatellia bacterium]|nr:hypothetical protein [Blastocatellia bacterium]
MTTNQATKEAPMIDQIEWDVVSGENTEFAIQYPRMQWVHGEKKAAGFNKTGGLFISDEQYPNFEATGFQPETFITRKKDLPGHGTVQTKLAVIRIKHQWTTEDGGKNVPLCHALVVVQGCEDLICLSLKGPSKSLEFQKAFNQHMAHNVALANRTRPADASALEPFALWFPIKAGDLQTATSKDGKSESVVTLPTLVQPEKLDRDYVVSLWVGAANYKQFTGYYKETATWQKVPIWEQRDAQPENGNAEFSGEERATDEQFHHFVNICTAKDFNEKDIVGEATKGVTDDFMQLSRSDARLLIEGLAKL